MFVEPGTGWADMTQNAELTATDGKPGDEFGSAVSVSNNVVAVGAPLAAVNGNAGQGTAYLFASPIIVFPGSSGWENESEDAAFNVPDNVAGEQFGASISISVTTKPQSDIPSGLTVVIGVPLDTVNGNIDQGAAYAFASSTSSTTAPIANQITSSDGVGGDLFGDSLSLSGNTVVIGAPEAAGGAAGHNGTAYVFAAATALDVEAAAATGTYGTGATIPIKVLFSDDVTVTGKPELALNAGSGAVAIYTGGSGTTTLTFTYTAAKGQSTSDLDYTSTTALKLNGGTIVGAVSGVAATLTLPAPGVVDGLAAKSIVIDPTAHAPATPILIGPGSGASPGPTVIGTTADVPLGPGGRRRQLQVVGEGLDVRYGDKDLHDRQRFDDELRDWTGGRGHLPVEHVRLRRRAGEPAGEETLPHGPRTAKPQSEHLGHAAPCHGQHVDHDDCDDGQRPQRRAVLLPLLDPRRPRQRLAGQPDLQGHGAFAAHDVQV